MFTSTVIQNHERVPWILEGSAVSLILLPSCRHKPSCVNWEAGSGERRAVPSWKPGTEAHGLQAVLDLSNSSSMGSTDSLKGRPVVENLVSHLQNCSSLQKPFLSFYENILFILSSDLISFISY